MVTRNDHTTPPLASPHQKWRPAWRWSCPATKHTTGGMRLSPSVCCVPLHQAAAHEASPPKGMATAEQADPGKEHTADNTNKSTDSLSLGLGCAKHARQTPLHLLIVIEQNVVGVGRAVNAPGLLFVQVHPGLVGWGAILVRHGGAGP